MERNNEDPLAPVAAAKPSEQAGEARDPWGGVERSVWTERMLRRLTSRESANRWFSHRGQLSLAAEHEWTLTIAAMRTH